MVLSPFDTSVDLRGHSRAKVSWRQKDLQGYPPGPHESTCFSSLLAATERSSLPASLRESRTRQDTLKESAKHMTDPLGLQSTIICPPPKPLQQNLMRAESLSALYTAQGWHVALCKHLLNEYSRVAVRLEYLES